jgi:hypothetical protein
MDLRADADAEAARIASARRLLEPEEAGDEPRPLLTRLRPRHRQRCVRCYWLFRLLLAAADGRVVATACVPFGGTALAPAAASSAWTRRLLDPAQPLVEEARAAAVGVLTGLAMDAGIRQLAAGVTRERALREELLRHQARLSVHVLQPGLFDRRQERAASAQAALLDEALAASSVRREQLSAAASLHVESCELVFGVVSD